MICSLCKAENPEGKSFCGDCGNSLKDNLVDPAVEREIARAVSARLKEQKVVEIEAAQAIISRLSDWARLFGFFVAIPLAVLAVALGFLGIRTYTDFSSRVSQAREEALAPLKDTKAESERIKQAYKDLDAQLEQTRALVPEITDLTRRVAQIEQVVKFKSSASLTPALRQTLDLRFRNFYAYLKGVGFSLTGQAPSVFVDAKIETNTYYEPPPKNQIVISADLAQFADSPLREYTHYTLSSLNPAALRTFGNNTVSLESGLADYFPSSFSNNSDYGREIWELVSKRYQVRVTNRNVDNHRSFNEIKQDTEVHDAGNVWAGAFWQLRQAIGQGLCDKLLLTAWKNLDVTKFATDMSLYPREIIKQDQMVEGGKHSQDIKKVFEERGLKL